MSEKTENPEANMMLSSLGKTPVKSTAVVKYSAVQSPATFAQLQCNTDLNLPPSNWLSSSAESYGLQSVWSQSTGFSSFRMAHMFPDCVGEVDVVSDAENIKKLLKLPYNNGLISMMVHRIENTLLLDDFDIHKYLLRQAESDWEWLKKFFYDNIFHNLGDKEKRLFHKADTRNSLQQKNLVSKFLYHSLVLPDDGSFADESCEQPPPLPVTKLEPQLPEPTREEKLPDPNYNHNYTRNVVWTFENIQMLVGTDMPIFGGQTHPCISLKLRDMAKPINVLTGIDYWLDNLMCNVPEVVMCYHLDGIVQKYELIKTEDLPNLDDSKFSSKLIRDVAQNILSFLKNNATKAGHTYWLFKGKNDDVVKLYDLTSLCSDISDDKGQNPFTVPVAMLLYRVARNMKNSSDAHRQRGTIRMLLQNCVQLLCQEKYPQIVTSAHFMLSDLYIPADTDPASPGVWDQSDEDDSKSDCGSSHESCNEKDDEDFENAIKSLTLTNMKELRDHEEPKFKVPPVTGSIEERCYSAIEHVAKGLECLKYFPTDKDEAEASYSVDERNEEKEQLLREEAMQNMAKPLQAIPMPYEPLNKPKQTETCESQPARGSQKKSSKKKSRKTSDNHRKTSNALLRESESDALSTWQAPKRNDNLSWREHLKTLLYEKASLIYAVLSEHEYSSKNYGASLKHTRAALNCQKVLELFCVVRNEKLISYLLGRAGDCCFMIVQDWKSVSKHRKDYDSEGFTELKVTDELDTAQELITNGVELLPDKLTSIEVTLVASYKCYERALSSDSSEMDRGNLLRRLGNIHNELGVLFMNQANARYQQENSTDTREDTREVTPLLEKSLKHFKDGLCAFEAVKDNTNLALLYSNAGRLMRQCAYVNSKQSSQERDYYKKALDYYQKALHALGSRKSNEMIWNSVTWDLSTTLYTMATLLQDYPTVEQKSEEEMEREVIEMLQKALKYCDMETPGSRQPVYQFRAANIQHRLASLYHRVYRNSDVELDATKRKANLQLSKLYYEKSSKILLALEQTVEFLTVQMERVALAEYQATIATNASQKSKAYQSALEVILQCQPMLEVMHSRNKDTKDSDGKENVGDNSKGDTDCSPTEEESTLLVLLAQRLQFILLSLTKLQIGKSTGNTNKESDNLGSLYKRCYAVALSAGATPDADHLSKLVAALEEIRNTLQGLVKC